jgi:hypothetical protein
MTRQRRHPAQASRIVAAGLSTATVLGIVAVLGAQPPAGTPAAPPEVASARTVLVVRVPTVEPAQQAALAPHTTSRPS